MAKQQYDWRHQQERAEWDAHLTANGPITCRRCGHPVYPDRAAHLNPDGMCFDLGHPEPGEDGTQPEHATCNRRAGGRRGRRDQLQPASQDWW